MSKQWNHLFEKTVQGITREQIWQTWSDVNNWTAWDKELEETKLSGAFQNGSHFTLKPKGGPVVKITITECEPLKSFTDVTHFPLAKMIDRHELIETPEGLKIRNELTVTGPLAWLWRKIVAENVANGMPQQIDSMIEYIHTKK